MSTDGITTSVPREETRDLTNLSLLDSSINEARLEFGFASGLENDFFADASIRAL